jgi:hypothetical protein
MVEPLTNAILASILHLIRRDLIGDRRAPPHWVPPHWVPVRRWHRRPCRSRPGATTSLLQYRLMEPSPPRSPGSSLPGPPLPPFGAPYTPRTQVDLGRLAGSLEGITPFTVAGLVRTPAIEE